MGQLSPLIWQLSRPSAITLILPHSCLLTGIALRAWAVHTPSISWAPISWAALCAWTYIHTIIQAVHTPPSSWVPIHGLHLVCVGRPHSVHFMGAHLMGCTLCVDIHTHYHTGRPHSAQFMGAHFMGCTSCVDYPT